jgi:hypothetical protein
MDIRDGSCVSQHEAAMGFKGSFKTGVCQLNLVIPHIGKHFQSASYVENLNGRRSHDDYLPHVSSLGGAVCKGVDGDQSNPIALVRQLAVPN